MIKKRGYPFKFKDLDDFLSFSQDLKVGLKKLGVPINNIRIQGSSLRTPKANDVDIAVIVDQLQFDNFLKAKYNKKILKNGEAIEISNLSSEELLSLAEEVRANKSIYNRMAVDDFAFSVVTKQINAKGSKEIIPNFKNMKNEIPSSQH